MVTLKQLSDGELQIVLNDKEELEDILTRQYDENIILSEMLDNAGYIGNGWGVPSNVGLTEAPVIAYDFSIDDEGNMSDCEKLWYFNWYMVENFAEKLKEDGVVIFSPHHDNNKE